MGALLTFVDALARNTSAATAGSGQTVLTSVCIEVLVQRDFYRKSSINESVSKTTILQFNTHFRIVCATYGILKQKRIMHHCLLSFEVILNKVELKEKGFLCKDKYATGKVRDFFFEIVRKYARYNIILP